MPHPLHEVIADLIATKLPPEIDLIRDPACIGTQRIPLFQCAERSRATWLCDVDCLLVINGRIRAIIEIDESNVKPTHVAGKFLASALATHYIHQTAGDPIPKADSVTFIEFLSAAGLPKGSRKPQQWEKLETAIRQIPTIGSIDRYELLYGKPDDFRSGSLMDRTDRIIEDVVSQIDFSGPRQPNLVPITVMTQKGEVPSGQGSIIRQECYLTLRSHRPLFMEWQVTRKRDPKCPWNPATPNDVSPEQYEKQVLEWLRQAMPTAATVDIDTRKDVSGFGGDYEIDIVIEFTAFAGARFVLLVECKRHGRPVERGSSWPCTLSYMTSVPKRA